MTTYSPTARTTCAVSGCNRHAQARGWCQMHYMRYRRHGNEGPVLSSELVREADELAWVRWPDEPRHFTFVDASKVRPKRDPGRCFLRAGWRDTGQRTGRGLHILEISR